MPGSVSWSSFNAEAWAPPRQGYFLFPHGPETGWPWVLILFLASSVILGKLLTFYLESGDHNTTYLTEFFWESSKKTHVAQGLEGTPWMSAMAISVHWSSVPGTYLFVFFLIQNTVNAQEMPVPFSITLLWQVFPFTYDKLWWHVPLGLILRKEDNVLPDGV